MRVKDYAPGKISATEAFNYGTLTSNEENDYFWCDRCDDKIPALCLADTGFGCSKCNNLNPPGVAFCAWCGGGLTSAVTFPG